MGQKWSEKNQEFLELCFFQSWKKTESKKFLDPCLELGFFSELQNGKYSRYPFLQLFRTRVMDTH